MALDLRDSSFLGPALPEPFVEFELERRLQNLKLLPKATGDEGRALQKQWEIYRRKLRKLGERGGAIRVFNHVLEPLVELLGYELTEKQAAVSTREGMESGGVLLKGTSAGNALRVWAFGAGADLDAPAKRGRAYRFSSNRVAHRVLLAAGERVGLLTNGEELRVLLSDPARPESQVSIRLDSTGGWRASRRTPDSLRLLIALASPEGLVAAPELVEQARLTQTRVTEKLREQARLAVEYFVQELLDNPQNQGAFRAKSDKQQLAAELWHEGLIFVYRLLFVFKLESARDPAQAFSFASTTLWRNTYSPNTGLAPHVRAVLDEGAETGRLLQEGLRSVFRFLTHGLASSEINISPLGGSLFGREATPLLDSLEWSESAVAGLLDLLLWTPSGKSGRQRVHYGPLDVEDLGRVYEALLELEPGIAEEPMCRLRRAKLEVVVPIEQGEKYRPQDDDGKKSGKTKVLRIEEIPAGEFYLRVGLGRKASGSYYTPQSFVRFLVQETLGPLVDERSPKTDPAPGAILCLKVLDPAMGSGHFLVEACRFLGEKLYEACRLCDQIAAEEETKAEGAQDTEAQEAHLSRAREYLQRVIDLPDPDDELVTYLPSRAPEGEESGLSQRKAEALCRRLVAVHCLYGVDNNILAVELAKLSLWIESHAEGLPLTFMDHRLVLGDSITGPFFEHLLRYPSTQEPMDDLLTAGLGEELSQALEAALTSVEELEASVGTSLSEQEAKQAAKTQLDRSLIPFRLLAAAWAGGVMLGPDECDDQAYAELATQVAGNRRLTEIPESQMLLRMIAIGLALEALPESSSDVFEALGTPETARAAPYEFMFPEVFFPKAQPNAGSGFAAVLGNPPWDKVRPKGREFFAKHDFSVMAAPTKRERSAVEERLRSDPRVQQEHEAYIEGFKRQHRIHDALYQHQIAEVEGKKTGGDPDLAKLFLERNSQLLAPDGRTGAVVPSAFHANAGATGLRRLYFEKMGLECCYSFENRRKLFEIDSRFKFALLVASRQGPTGEFRCGFYLHDDEWLFSEREKAELVFGMSFVRDTGGEYLSLMEPRSSQDIALLEQASSERLPFGDYVEGKGIRLGRELDTTDDSWRFTPVLKLTPDDPRQPATHARLIRQRCLVLAEGRMFNQYDELFGVRPRYCVQAADLGDRPPLLEAARYFRLSYRSISASTNERTGIFCLLPPGYTTARSCPCDGNAAEHPYSASLIAMAICNSFGFDYLLRLCVSSATLNYFFLKRTPMPTIKDPGQERFLAHASLRLCSNHSGFEPLWRAELGECWREEGSAMQWPVIPAADKRAKLQASVDALVAAAYGFSIDDYRHLLSCFSHKGLPEMPELCLAQFGELQDYGLSAFLEKNDPYGDIPLCKDLPEPGIDLPVIEIQEVAEPTQSYLDLEVLESETPTPKSHKPQSEGD